MSSNWPTERDIERNRIAEAERIAERSAETPEPKYARFTTWSLPTISAGQRHAAALLREIAPGFPANQRAKYYDMAELMDRTAVILLEVNVERANLKASLDEIINYNGGAPNALEDEYVMWRAEKAHREAGE